MGTDIVVHLLYGHKMTLSKAFENGLIYPGIMKMIGNSWTTRSIAKK